MVLAPSTPDKYACACGPEVNILNKEYHYTTLSHKSRMLNILLCEAQYIYTLNGLNKYIDKGTKQEYRRLKNTQIYGERDRFKYAILSKCIDYILDNPDLLTTYESLMSRDIDNKRVYTELGAIHETLRIYTYIEPYIEKSSNMLKQLSGVYHMLDETIRFH